MHCIRRPERRHAARRALLAVTLVASAGLAGCTIGQPEALEGIGESVLQLGDAVSALQQENALIQEQLDSLRLVVAKQDTALRRFANLAGMPLP